MIEVLTPGPLATVQDGGRVGYLHLGVGRCGAADRGALVRANRLVGNPPLSAAVEITMGGLAVCFARATTIALCGAPCPGCDVDVPVTFPAGASLRLGVPAHGLRTYLAVRGGIDVPAVLGSRSTDTLSGLGPPPLRAGDQLPVGGGAAGPVSSEIAVAAPRPAALSIVAGPRADWFTSAALATLTGVAWTVRPESDRVGVRLEGPPLRRARGGELPSEPTLPGALQVPPDGRPILLGPDAPVTGGYPVIAVVRTRDLDAIAQLRPGDVARFAG